MLQKSSVVLGALLAVLSGVEVASAEVTVIGQVAFNEVRMDGALVPTGTTVLSPSLLSTGAYSSTVHLATGQSLNLAPHSSAYFESGPQGLEVSARSGVVEVGRLSGEPMRLASNTVALLSPQEPGTSATAASPSSPATGDPIERIKMCKPDGTQVWVVMSETAVQNGIDQGWGVAGVAPWDKDCNKQKVAGFIWTPLKVAGLIAGSLVVGAVVADQINGDDKKTQCQSATASPFVPGVAICNTF